MKNKTYGYASVTTPHQNLERQTENIHREYPDAIVFQDKYIATRIERPEWTRLMRIIKPGDTIVLDEVSRMSRDAEEGFKEYAILFDRGVELVFLKEPYINTAVYKNALEAGIDVSGGEMADTLIEAVNKALQSIRRQQIETAFASSQKEADIRHERIIEGIKRAQASGKTVGRPIGSKIETRKAKEQKQVILEHSKDFGGSLNDVDCIKLTGLARNTFYKYKRELRETML